ncbi:MAG TPA: DUF899 domain-containing protein [Candidatus Eisenbacteria bacterium]|nr:DUF899 domain-containing protein [Candidatus Eisenbacteria bacterium]
MTLPKAVSREEWLIARKHLLVEEEAMTRALDALAVKRRALPMVEIEKDYVFAGPRGEASLLDLFDGRRQLIVRHFMFDPSWDEGCPGCTAKVGEISDSLLRRLQARSTTLVVVSRAPLAKVEAYRARMGWTLPWYSSFGSDFNYDFHVTLDASIAPVVYNYRTRAELEEAGRTDYLEGEAPGLSCFLRDGDRVFHTYSAYGPSIEMTGGSHFYLDLTALGRQDG